MNTPCKYCGEKKSNHNKDCPASGSSVIGDMTKWGQGFTDGAAGERWMYTNPVYILGWKMGNLMLFNSKLPVINRLIRSAAGSVVKDRQLATNNMNYAHAAVDLKEAEELTLQVVQLQEMYNELCKLEPSWRQPAPQPEAALP